MKAFFVLLTLANLSLAAEPRPAVPYSPYEFDPAEWPAVTVRFSDEASLKNLFDSGLRPYRYPGLERVKLEVKHFRLTVRLASGKVLPEMPVEKMDISPFGDGAIATLRARSPKLTLEQARDGMAPWLRFGERDRGDLERYLKAVQADFLSYDDPYSEGGTTHGCAAVWKEPGFGEMGGGPKCSFAFDNTADKRRPLRLYLNLSWGLNRPLKLSSPYDGPIPPPEGYEDVSMEAPESFGPDSAVDILRSQGIDIGEAGAAKQEDGKAAEEGPTAQISRDAPPMEVSPDADRPDPQPKWPWVIAGLLALSVVAILLRTVKRKSVP